jgi:hypothetical protein
MVAGYEKLTPLQKTRLDRKDWWTHLSDIGFTRDDLILRDLGDSTDFGESIRHVSAFAALAEYAESSPKNEMDYKMTGGNSRLVEEFAKRVGTENIRTGIKVTGISQRRGQVHVTAEPSDPKNPLTSPLSNLKGDDATIAALTIKADACWCGDRPGRVP